MRGAAGKRKPTEQFSQRGGNKRKSRAERECILDDSSSDSDEWQQPLTRLKLCGNKRKRKYMPGGNDSDDDSGSDSDKGKCTSGGSDSDDTQLVCSRREKSKCNNSSSPCKRPGVRKRRTPSERKRKGV